MTVRPTTLIAEATVIAFAAQLVLVFSQPYNSELAGPRAATWSEAEHWVLDEITASGRFVQAPIAFPETATRRLPNTLPQRGVLVGAGGMES